MAGGPGHHGVRDRHPAVAQRLDQDRRQSADRPARRPPRRHPRGPDRRGRRQPGDLRPVRRQRGILAVPAGDDDLQPGHLGAHAAQRQPDHAHGRQPRHRLWPRPPVGIPELHPGRPGRRLADRRAHARHRPAAAAGLPGADPGRGRGAAGGARSRRNGVAGRLAAAAARSPAAAVHPGRGFHSVQPRHALRLRLAALAQGRLQRGRHWPAVGDRRRRRGHPVRLRRRPRAAIGADRPAVARRRRRHAALGAVRALHQPARAGADPAAARAHLRRHPSRRSLLSGPPGAGGACRHGAGPLWSNRLGRAVRACHARQRHALCGVRRRCLPRHGGAVPGGRVLRPDAVGEGPK